MIFKTIMESTMEDNTQYNTKEHNMPNFTMLVGLPGSGKSYYAKHQYFQRCIISSDETRRELFDDINDQTHNTEVFEHMKKQTILALKEGRSVIFDATNLVARHRRGLLSQLPRNTYKEVLVFATHPDVCKKRLPDRDHEVAVETVDKMMRRFQLPWYNEGWNHVQILHAWENQEHRVDLETMLVDAMTIPHDNPHHILSIGEHMRAMSDYAKYDLREPLTMRATLSRICRYHDIGKPDTKAFFNTKGKPTEIAHYYGHENIGAYYALLSNKLSLQEVLCINHHMDLFNITYEKLEARFGKEIAHILAKVHEYDIQHP